MDLVFSSAGSSSVFSLKLLWSKDVREVAVARHLSSHSSCVGLGRCVHPGLSFARKHRAEPLLFWLYPREEPSIESAGANNPHVRAPQVAQRGASGH